MNLVIDFGNTSTKIAVFDGNDLKAFEAFDRPTVNQIAEFIKLFPDIKSAILCSVIHHDHEIERFLSTSFHLLKLDSKTVLPIANRYETPSTLGLDRIAVAVAGNNMFPERNLLVIDAGTCIKYEFVNSSNQYMGGNISPGLGMRFRALNSFTDKLPLIAAAPVSELYGTSTESAIRNGVILGVVAEIKGVISLFHSQYDQLATVITGGDAIFFERELKIGIFADSFLLLKGLNIILNHNSR